MSKFKSVVTVLTAAAACSMAAGGYISKAEYKTKRQAIMDSM